MRCETFPYEQSPCQCTVCDSTGQSALKQCKTCNPPNQRPNSADFANLFCQFVGFLNFADLFCRLVGVSRSLGHLTRASLAVRINSKMCIIYFTTLEKSCPFIFVVSD